MKLTGYDRSEVNGRNCRFLQGPDTDRESVKKIGEAVSKNLDIGIDLLNYKKDGTPSWNSLYLSPVPNDKGVPQYYFASQFDVTERKKYELDRIAVNLNLETLVQSRTRELEEALQTSKILMHEMDHRVKNNLQMISAMLMLQSVSIMSTKSREVLFGSDIRISADKAARARKDADKLACAAWNFRMLATKVRRNRHRRWRRHQRGLYLSGSVLPRLPNAADYRARHHQAGEDDAHP